MVFAYFEDTYALFHGSFFGMHLNSESRVLLHSGRHNTKHLFFTCSQFCEEFKYVTQILSLCKPGKRHQVNPFLII